MAERGYLLLSATASGIGRAPTGADGVGAPLEISGQAYSRGHFYWSGIGTASGTLWGRPDSGWPWYAITGFAWNNTVFNGSGFISGVYGYYRATLTFTANSTGHLFLQLANH